MSDMEATKDFIELLETRETWTLDRIDNDLLERAKELSGMIVQDIQSAKSVPVKTWVVFLALLPYGQSLTALSDLALVLPNLLRHIATEEYEDGSMHDRSRNILIERMNVLMRRRLHSSVLTEQRRKVINTVIRAIDGYHQQ